LDSVLDLRTITSWSRTSFRIGTFLASFTILPNVFRSSAGKGGRAACGPVVLRYRNLVVATGDAGEESHRWSAHGNRERQQQITAAWQSVLQRGVARREGALFDRSLAQEKRKICGPLRPLDLAFGAPHDHAFLRHEIAIPPRGGRERGACHARDLLNNSQRPRDAFDDALYNRRGDQQFRAELIGLPLECFRIRVIGRVRDIGAGAGEAGPVVPRKDKVADLVRDREVLAAGPADRFTDDNRAQRKIAGANQRPLEAVRSTSCSSR
jgi:hypothetical protein